MSERSYIYDESKFDANDFNTRHSLQQSGNCINGQKLNDLHLQVENKLELGIDVGIVDLEKSVNKLFEVNVATVIQVEYRKEALSNNTWKLTILIHARTQ